MQNWENRRSFLINSTAFVLLFLLIYFLTSILMGGVFAFITPVALWVWVLIINGFMLIMVATKFSEMKEGVDYVMKKLGAIEINPMNHNPIIARYMQVVSEMTIAANIKTPKLYLLPSYDINAFAISTNEYDVAIAATEGAVTRLTRSELQALVGHEISHILHKDPILNFRLIGWLFGLQSVYLYGHMMFSFFTREFFGDLDVLNRFCLGYSLRTVGSGGGGIAGKGDIFSLLFFCMLIVTLPIIGLSLLIMMVGAIGAICARIMKAIISREREYLADSESVRFVRGKFIVQVLEKIALLSGDEEYYNSTKMDATHQEFSHFYLQNYQEKTSIFDTHPPIMKRILKIYPRYRAINNDVYIKNLDQKFVDQSENSDDVLVSALHSYAISRRNNMGHNIVIELGLDQSMGIILNKLAKCYAVFISAHNVLIKRQQLEYLRGKLHQQLFFKVMQEAEVIIQKSDLQRLQILTSELPNFDRFAHFQVVEIEEICHTLAMMDDKLTIAEYCMFLMVRVQILKMAKKNGIDYQANLISINETSQQMANLLSVVTTITFHPNINSAEKCYVDIASYLQIPHDFQGMLSWQRVLDETLPLMVQLNLRDKEKLENIFMQLNASPQKSLDANSLLFILLRSFKQYFD